MNPISKKGKPCCQKAISKVLDEVEEIQAKALNDEDIYNEETCNAINKLYLMLTQKLKEIRGRYEKI